MSFLRDGVTFGSGISGSVLKAIDGYAAEDISNAPISPRLDLHILVLIISVTT
jgi:hypothetical protein